MKGVDFINSVEVIYNLTNDSNQVFEMTNYYELKREFGGQILFYRIRNFGGKICYDIKGFPVVQLSHCFLNLSRWRKVDMEEVLFDEDLEKINNAVVKYPMGSYQIGEIARLSGLLYGMGVDVENQLHFMCNKYGVFI